jgi:hypothetical protein
MPKKTTNGSSDEALSPLRSQKTGAFCALSN